VPLKVLYLDTADNSKIDRKVASLRSPSFVTFRKLVATWVEGFDLVPAC
jgi:hypothetical protein